MALLDPGTPTDLADLVRSGLQQTFGATAEVVARAPGRVNLIGEHTDYNRGLVLPVALPHATYAAAARRSDDLVRISSAQQDEPWEGRLDELGQAKGWAAYAAGTLWALREAGVEVPGLEMYVAGTVPLGAGLSSSAAIECAVAVAALGLVGTDVDSVRDKVVAACMRAEGEVAGAPTGGMDQTVAMYAAEGSALLVDFGDDSRAEVPLGLDEAGLVLLVTDTRVSHELTDGGYASRRADCEEAARALGVPSLRDADTESVAALEDERVRRRARHVVTEIARVSDTLTALSARDWTEVGRLFAASHVSMRDDFEISTPELDLAVVTAVEAGAVGARMTGGGFGGSTVALVPRERLEAVVRAIDTAFVRDGHGAPAHLLAVPGPGAALVG